jgi:tetratricopeptide (TPR) repeat protein/O-antigen ligase
MKKYLKLIIFGSIFALPFISFIVVNGMFFPYISGKNFAFRALVELSFGAWVALALIDAEYRPKISNITLAITGLIVVIGIADFLGANPARSIWSNYERMDGYVTTFHAFLYFIVLTSVVRAQKDWDKLFHVMITTSVILAFVSFKDVLMPNFNGRADATMGNPIYLAVYMLFHIFISAYYLFKEEIKTWGFKQYCYIAAIFIQMLSLYYTATRGTILGVVGGLFLAAGIIALFEKKQILLRKVAIWSVTGILILIGSFFVAKDSSFVRQNPVLGRFAGISIEDSSTKARFIVWNMAYQGFLERPVLGWGQENFPYVFNKYYDPNLYFAEPWYDRAHNVFMDWLVSGGILGLFSYLMIFVAAVHTLWKKKEDDFQVVSKALLVGLLAGYFVHNVFVFDNLTSYILFFTVLAYIHFRSTDAEDSKNILSRFFEKVSKPFQKNSFNEENQGIIISIIGAATIAMIAMVNLHPYQQNRLLVETLRLQDSQVDSERGLDIFKQILSYNSFNDFGTGEARERLVIKANQVAGSQKVTQEVKEAYFGLAYNEIEKQIQEVSGDSKYLIMESSLFSTIGNFPKAIEILNRALLVSPKKDMIITTIGDSYLNMGSNQEALNTYKIGFDNAPKNQAMAKRYALAALSLGNEKLAADILIPLFGTFPIPDELIMRFYENKGKLDVVIKTYETAIQDKDGSKVVDYRLKLATVFFRMKDDAKAIAILQQGIIDIPKDSELRMNLANVFLQLKENEKAIEVLKQAAIDIPQDYKIRYSLASIYLQERDLKNAIIVLEQVLKDFPGRKYPDVYRNTLSTLQELKKK